MDRFAEPGTAPGDAERERVANEIEYRERMIEYHEDCIEGLRDEIRGLLEGGCDE